MIISTEYSFACIDSESSIFSILLPFRGHELYSRSLHPHYLPSEGLIPCLLDGQSTHTPSMNLYTDSLEIQETNFPS